MASRARAWAILAVLLAISAIAPMLATLAVASSPGGDLGLEVVAFGLWLVVGAVWLVSLIRAAQPTRSIAGLCASLSVPVVLLLTVVLWGTGAPLRVRFEASRSAFEALPAAHLSSESVVPAGLYVVSEFESTAFGYRFVVSDQNSVIYGFAFSPAGPPPGPDINLVVTNEDGYRHLDGPWYIWEYIRT